ncbi:metallophosphoesterase [Victivallis sp. Marseille-Q1083]|uniref:metallophosphoesterase n=1 Tax=Victivallis sp. Marseille-Q1083 TaxID=2717288 RepID=UPI00158F675E|nr:metallophosphoesterase [Victivallis sp. Marseille-Q1083]
MRPKPFRRISQLALLLLPFLSGGCGSVSQPATVRFAAFADVQYCSEHEELAGRHYRRSRELLAQTIEALNGERVDFAVNLGDLVDHGWQNYPPVLQELEQLQMPLYSVLGNHDFEVGDRYKRHVSVRLGMPAPYYAFRLGNWRFLALDTNEISLYAWPAGSAEADRYARLIAEQYPEERRHGYNGGYSAEQLHWIEAQLAEAAEAGEAVVILQHCPIEPGGKCPATLNSDRLLELLDRYEDTVKLCLSGHHHAGGQFVRRGVLFKTVKGQVEAGMPTYVIVELSEKNVTVHGFGDEAGSRLPAD